MRLSRLRPAHAAEAIAGRALERWLGVRTRDFVELDAVGAAAPNRIWHSASAWVPTWRALRSASVGRGDVLLDYGAGKGRALVVASRFPFQRLIGLEISASLARDARANLARCGDRVEIVVADAADWPVPDDVTVVYMYCPFTGAVFAGAVEQLLLSLARRPRRLRLIYNNPFEHNFLLGTGRFRVVDAIAAVWPPRLRRRPSPSIVTYEAIVPDVAPAPARPRAGGWTGRRDTRTLLPEGFEPLPG